MKAAIIYLLLAVSAFAVDRDRLLEAIRIREGGSRPGKHGETGLFQMMPKTRLDARGDDKAAATRHLVWLERNFRAYGIDPNAYNLALAWNAGLETVREGKATLASYRYATAVERLYHVEGVTITRRFPFLIQLPASK